jgi:putative hemolysin
MSETEPVPSPHAPRPSGLRASAPPAGPEVVLREGRYLARFARTADEMAAALRLRYEVFNLELNEGLEQSHLLGRDEDSFDEACHHLLVIDGPADRIVGTYRMQTREMARAHRGFYSDGEYVLDDLGEAVLDDAVEIGRACVAREHRKQKVLFLLWKGLAAYLTWQQKRYLFGCCSLTSQDGEEGRAVMERLRRDGKVRDDLRVRARPGFECHGPAAPDERVRAVTLPTLFGTYLRFGALVCSEPAIDREFRTIDFLVLMDTSTLPERVRSTFYGA